MKATNCPQFPLPLSNHTGVDDVPDSILANKADLLGAINLCIDVSGYQHQQVAEGLGVSVTQLSKYLSGSHNFPPNLIRPLQTLCGNLIPLRWLAYHSGQRVEPMLSTVEQQLADAKSRLAEKERELETILRFVKQAGWRA